MAEIKIEQKQGSSSWIWWLLGLLVLAAILWWFFAARGGDQRTAAAAGEAASAIAATTPGPDSTTTPITDVQTLTAANAGDLVGRRVMLERVPVQDVVSDKGFWIGDASQRLFALRMNQLSPATPPNGAVNTGEIVSVYGVVERMPADLTQQTTTWNLRSTDTTALAKMPVYVRADSVHINTR